MRRQVCSPRNANKIYPETGLTMWRAWESPCYPKKKLRVSEEKTSITLLRSWEKCSLQANHSSKKGKKKKLERWRGRFRDLQLWKQKSETGKLKPPGEAAKWETWTFQVSGWRFEGHRTQLQASEEVMIVWSLASRSAQIFTVLVTECTPCTFTPFQQGEEKYNHLEICQDLPSKKKMLPGSRLLLGYHSLTFTEGWKNTQGQL